MNIPLSKPYLTGNELACIEEAIQASSLGGDGLFSKKCIRLLTSRIGAPVFLTPSGTQAIELAFMALGLEKDDEVILPSYTFVSSANAVVQMGLKPVFIDVRADTINIDESLIENAITPKTKAILVVHYGGIAANMDAIMALARRYKLAVIEDAAHGINAYYKGRHLGSIGDMGILSFHHTKNVTSGEGGAIIINDAKYLRAVEMHRQKGTDRALFLRGEVEKYRWVTRGSNYYMADLLAAFLFPQLQALDDITLRRKTIVEAYVEHFTPLSRYGFRLPTFPPDCRPGYHNFFLLFEQRGTLEGLRDYLRERGIEATTHFLPLHASPGGERFGVARSPMTVSEQAGQCLLRLPLYAQMTREEQDRVIANVTAFFEG